MFSHRTLPFPQEVPGVDREDDWAGSQHGGVARPHLLPAGDEEEQSVLRQAEEGREESQGEVQH